MKLSPGLHFWWLSLLIALYNVVNTRAASNSHHDGVRIIQRHYSQTENFESNQKTLNTDNGKYRSGNGCPCDVNTLTSQ
jgi:hypothetical protein